MKVDEKHFTVGATCKMHKGSMVSFGKYNDILIALKESAVTIMRGTKCLIQKEVEVLKQLDDQNVIKLCGIEKECYVTSLSKKCVTEQGAKQIHLEEELKTVLKKAQKKDDENKRPTKEKIFSALHPTASGKCQKLLKEHCHTTLSLLGLYKYVATKVEVFNEDTSQLETLSLPEELPFIYNTEKIIFKNTTMLFSFRNMFQCFKHPHQPLWIYSKDLQKWSVYITTHIQ